MEIAKALRINRSTVWQTLKRFGKMGDATDRLRSGRPCTACTKKKDQSHGRKNPEMPEKINKKNGQGA